jgi:hypothetical protein
MDCVIIVVNCTLIQLTFVILTTVSHMDFRNICKIINMNSVISKEYYCAFGHTKRNTTF